MSGDRNATSVYSAGFGYTNTVHNFAIMNRHLKFIHECMLFQTDISLKNAKCQNSSCKPDTYFYRKKLGLSLSSLSVVFCGHFGGKIAHIEQAGL